MRTTATTAAAAAAAADVAAGSSACTAGAAAAPARPSAETDTAAGCTCCWWLAAAAAAAAAGPCWLALLLLRLLPQPPGPLPPRAITAAGATAMFWLWLLQQVSPGRLLLRLLVMAGAAGYNTTRQGAWPCCCACATAAGGPATCRRPRPRGCSRPATAAGLLPVLWLGPAWRVAAVTCCRRLLLLVHPRQRQLPRRHWYI